LSTTRSYRSPQRTADAAATRATIVEAAATLFSRDGYAATPMRAIAAAAGVSVPSVNLAGPKSALLLAAFERTFAGDEGQHPLTERPVMAEILGEADPATLLVRYVGFIGAANARSAGIWRALIAAADADELVRAASTDLERRRRRDLALGVQVLVARGLIAETRAASAADVLGFLTSSQSYLYFVEDSGWDRARYEGWLATSIQRLVLAP
jgi:AcrR family transcriptional regulator